MGEEMGESPKQVQRYLRIADLIPEILEMLDDGKIGFTPAYEAVARRIKSGINGRLF